MAFIRPVVRSAMDHTGDPVAALERVNRILVEERPTGLLVTVLCAVLDLDTGDLVYANAGHELPLVIRADGALEELAAAGPLLGAFRSLDLERGTARLEAADTLVLYTDGVTDAARPGGERFGIDRFRGLVREHCAVSAGAVVRTVMDAVATWEGDEPADDLALLVVRRSSSAAPVRGRAAVGAGQLYRAAAAQQLEDQDDQGDHQQHVDEGADDVRREAQQPQHQQDHDQRPEHPTLLGLTGRSGVERPGRGSLAVRA